MRSRPRKHRSHIDRVVKSGEGYLIRGTHDGHRAEFYVGSEALDKMPMREAKEFMERSIANIIRHQKEE